MSCLFLKKRKKKKSLRKEGVYTCKSNPTTDEGSAID
jgi:hypothetical protein